MEILYGICGSFFLFLEKKIKFNKFWLQKWIFVVFVYQECYVKLAAILCAGV